MAKRKRKKTLADLEPEGDAQAALDSKLLLSAATPVLKTLEADLLSRARESAALTRALTARHADDVESRRTADAYDPWLRHFVEQVAAAWLLSCVFVRTLEDRGLLDQNRIAGPGAADAQRTFLQIAPSLSERDYLLTVFRELTHLPAAQSLFDAKHNPVWLLAPSAEALKPLLELFRTPTPDAPALRFGQPSTRFLGDLYQDLNENVRKRFALLQTPDFIESFILDRTLEPAIEKFGLESTTLIDPTCGSGHFLLGAFDRLLDHRLRNEPGLTAGDAARKALDAVFGADINPYAVAVARFRLTLAFLDKAGFQKLADAPELPQHVVVADSLLHNPQLAQSEFGALEGQSPQAWGGAAYALEDEAAARDVLHRRFAAVVGNPPYITVKDKVLRDRYRDMYSSAFRSYSLGVPFTQRFFQLGRDGARVGMITANSFMKREFGTKLIQEFLPTIDLDLIVNTSGAYIPGHGTPTVLLFGVAAEPSSDEVLVVLAKRGEPTTPEDPTTGRVWSSIAGHWSDVGFANDYVSVAKVMRAQLGEHPWSLAGGGANELKKLLESRASSTLADHCEGSIGRAARIALEQVFLSSDTDDARRRGFGSEHLRCHYRGAGVRDWTGESNEVVWFPYGDQGEAHLACNEKSEEWSADLKVLWPYRTALAARRTFQGDMAAAGLAWFEYMQFTPSAMRGALQITFANIATHNHFTLVRGRHVFNSKAPIIKLPPDATEDDHLALLAYLNSSTACFWMKQVFQDKGATIEKNMDPAKTAYEFAGTQMGQLPLTVAAESKRSDFAALAGEMDRVAGLRSTILDRALPSDSAEISGPDLNLRLHAASVQEDALDGRLVWLQEEIDWLVYEVWGLATTTTSAHETLAVADESLPLGARPHEVVAARQGESVGIDGQLLHSSVPNTVPARVAEIVERRIALLADSPQLRLLEATVHKRRWLTPRVELGAGRVETFDVRLHRYLSRWVSDRVEKLVSRRPPDIFSRRDVLGWANTDHTLVVATEVLDPDSASRLALALENDAVPYISTHRYTQLGLDKRAVWEQVWQSQRREDAGDAESISSPPKYGTPDFCTKTIWRLRGKLDVPKERFISYPGCESDEDGEPVYGWAGWNHLQRAQALVALYQDRKQREAWAVDRLTPMLAGLLELLPWLLQWHDEPDPDHGGERPAQEYKLFLDGECRLHGLSHDDLRAWRPAAKKKTAARRKKRKA